MLGIFGSPPHADPVLGQLRRSRGHWRGAMGLAGGADIPLIVAGSRAGPDAAARGLATAATALWSSQRASIERAVFEHVVPYLEAIPAGEADDRERVLPQVESAAAIGPHIAVRYVAVIPLDGSLVTEFGLNVPWDEEHTLGARFRDGRLLELCGSVLAP
jgi:hypothetical protein